MATPSQPIYTSTRELNPRRYRRAPLPPKAHARMGGLAASVLLLIACPFIGFFMHGVTPEGLSTGLFLGIVPATVLTALSAVQLHAWRTLDPEVAAEWRLGRVVSPEGGPQVESPALFADKGYNIEFRADGIVLSKSAVVGFRRARDAGARAWLTQTLGELFIKWSEVSEWSVRASTDAHGTYGIVLRDKSIVLVRRFIRSPEHERELLDAVRSIGSVPVRLLADV